MGFLFRRRPDIAAEVARLRRHAVDAPTCDRLAAWLAEAPPRELLRANPRLVAERLGLAERPALRLLVQALDQGLVTLSWEVECPSCRFVDPVSRELGRLRAEHTCPTCQTLHPTDADGNVRVTFSLDERLRDLSAADDPAFRQQVDARYGPVSGHALLTLQLFRDLFPTQTLPLEESMLIRRVAILFTDLAGSTGLYLRRGDPRAFELVRRHFDRLFALVDAHDGIVVKTIGDAIMGAFTDPAAAVRAALAMHQDIDELNAALGLAPPDALVLKVGVHVGPCISVTLNGRMDYFGTTVNAAARVQGASLGGDIAFSQAALDDPAIERMLASSALQSAELQLKGFEGPMRVWRLELPAQRSS
jgi:class 3 adenylate cyclase